MSQQMSRRSAVKVATGASFLFALHVAGCCTAYRICLIAQVKGERSSALQEMIAPLLCKGVAKAVNRIGMRPGHVSCVY